MHNRIAMLGGDSGTWRVLSVKPVRGETLAGVSRVDVVPAGAVVPDRPAAWMLQGLISNLRYATRHEVTTLRALQAPLGRLQARRAALIPIRKSNAWWALAQDERRAIFEEQSHHTAVGTLYLPAVARQLYHCRDLAEPFDFLTWFEYAEGDAVAFEDLVARLRATPEWSFVEREVDIRLAQDA